MKDGNYLVFGNFLMVLLKISRCCLEPSDWRLPEMSTERDKVQSGLKSRKSLTVAAVLYLEETLWYGDYLVYYT